MKVEKQLAQSLLTEALECLYSQDISLFDYKGNNYELSIAFRVAHFLATIVENGNQFKPEIKIDSEYTRHIENEKCCFEGCKGCQKGYLDKCYVYEHEKEILKTQNKRKSQDNKKDELEQLIRPDIIMHERRHNHNLLVIEIKTPKKLSKNPDILDAAKLAYLTCPYPTKKEHCYRYNVGVALCLTNNAARLWFYANGLEDGSITIPCNSGT